MNRICQRCGKTYNVVSEDEYRTTIEIIDKNNSDNNMILMYRLCNSCGEDFEKMKYEWFKNQNVHGENLTPQISSYMKRECEEDYYGHY